jgi:hypothetical protein
VEVALNVASDYTSKRSYEIVDLSRVCDTDSIGDTNSVDTHLVNGLIDAKQVNEVGSEGVLGGESNFDALGFDKLDNLNRSLGDVRHILAMGEVPQELGSAHDDIDTIDTGLDCDTGVVHVASDVCDDLGLEAKFADGLTVLSRLLRSGRRGELDAIDTKIVKRLGDLDLGLSVEEGIGKLLALSECRLDNLEVGDIAQEVRISVLEWLDVADITIVNSSGNAIPGSGCFDRDMSVRHVAVNLLNMPWL